MLVRFFIAASLAAGLSASATSAAWAEGPGQTIVNQSQWYLPAAEAEPLALPRSMTSARAWHTGSTVDTGFAGDYWLGASLKLGAWADPTALPIGDPASQSIIASGFLAPSGSIWGITPYIGAGIGAAPADTPTFAFGEFDSSWSFAYQGVAGFSVSWTPMLTTGIEYRYFATTDEFALTSGPHADQSYQSHDVMLRIDLGF